MQASARALWGLLLAFAIVGSSAGRAIGSHHVFSSSVDRFEVDGNTFGPADGTLDYVDEFDNGAIAPDWVQLLGTAVEAGGVVTLQNPGTDYTIGSTTFDVSNIENEDPVVNGSGNFTATAYWLPTLAADGPRVPLPALRSGRDHREPRPLRRLRFGRDPTGDRGPVHQPAAHPDQRQLQQPLLLRCAHRPR